MKTLRKSKINNIQEEVIKNKDVNELHLAKFILQEDSKIQKVAGKISALSNTHSGRNTSSQIQKANEAFDERIHMMWLTTSAGLNIFDDVILETNVFLLPFEVPDMPAKLLNNAKMHLEAAKLSLKKWFPTTWSCISNEYWDFVANRKFKFTNETTVLDIEHQFANYLKKNYGADSNIVLLFKAYLTWQHYQMFYSYCMKH